MKLFDPPMAPDAPLTRRPSYSVRMANFGDGYSQRTPAGLNAKRQQLQARWSFLTAEQADAIEAWFDLHGGASAFLWLPPGYPAEQPVPWIVGEFERQDESTRVTLSATFIRVFDIGVWDGTSGGSP